MSLPVAVVIQNSCVKRSKAFADEENVLLLQLARNDIRLLKGKFGPTVTKKGKESKWAEIAKAINSMNGTGGRTGVECMKRYDNMMTTIR